MRYFISIMMLGMLLKPCFSDSRGFQTFEATAYTSGYESCGKWSKYGLTKTGKKVSEGMVAVDPRVIPLKSKVYIEGLGVYSAEDVGGAIRGKRIDIFIRKLRDARQFGRKKVKVRVIIRGY